MSKHTKTPLERFIPLERVINFIFPTFSEASFVLLISLFVFLFALHPEYIRAQKEIFNEPRTLIYLIGILFVVIKMFQNRKFSEKEKKGVCLIYYLIFAAMTIFSSPSIKSNGHSLIQILNSSFYFIYQWVATIRLVIIYFGNKFESQKLIKLYVGSYSDVQLDWRDFAVLAMLGLLSLIAVDYYYVPVATVITLSFFYASFAYRIYSLAFKRPHL